MPIPGQPFFDEDIGEWLEIDEHGFIHKYDELVGTPQYQVPVPPERPPIGQQTGISGAGDAKVEMKISWSAPYKDVVRFAEQAGQMPPFVPGAYMPQAPMEPASSYYPPEPHPAQPAPYYEQPEQPVSTEYTDTRAQEIPILPSELGFIEEDKRQDEQQTQMLPQTLAEAMKEHALPAEVANDNKNKKRLTFRKVRNIGGVVLALAATGPLYQAFTSGAYHASICAENGLDSIWSDPLCPITSWGGELINLSNIGNYTVEKP